MGKNTGVNLELCCAWKIVSTVISVSIDIPNNPLLSNVVNISLRQKDNFESHNFVILILPNFRDLHSSFVAFKSFFDQLLLIILVYLRKV